MTASALHLVPPTADSINRDGRQNKKSKWDKVFIQTNVSATWVTFFLVHSLQNFSE